MPSVSSNISSMLCTNIQKFGVSKIFFITLIQKRHIKLFKSDSKDTYNVTKNMFTDQITILEWFLEDLVTLKTGVIAAEIQLITNKLHFKNI